MHGRTKRFWRIIASLLVLIMVMTEAGSSVMAAEIGVNVPAVLDESVTDESEAIAEDSEEIIVSDQLTDEEETVVDENIIEENTVGEDIEEEEEVLVEEQEISEEALGAAVDLGSCGTNVKASYDASTGTLRIYGTGAMTDYTLMSKTPWYSYYNLIQSVVIDNGVTRIGDNSFESHTALKSVSLPNTLVSIGYRSFEKCTALESITIPGSVKKIGDRAFFDCKNITTVNASSISAWMQIQFEGYNGNPTSYAKKLTINGNDVIEVVVPESITTISPYAFVNCEGLKKVKLHENVTSIGSRAFAGCTGLRFFYIPKSVTTIGEYVFISCHERLNLLCGAETQSSKWSTNWNRYKDSDAYKLNVNYGISPSDGDYWIGFDSGLLKVNIPSGVTVIPSKAFYNRSDLTSINIPNTVTTIGDNAFFDCTGLTTIYFPSSIRYVGARAFAYCKNISGVTTQNISDWEKITFADAESNPIHFSHNLFYNGTSIINVVIDPSVTSISPYAFYELQSLKTVDLNNVTSVGASAFAGCANLENVTIPSGMKSIGNMAFSRCEKFTRIFIPKSVEKMGESIFYKCVSNLELRCGAASQPSGWSTIWNKYKEDGAQAAMKLNITWGCPEEITSLNISTSGIAPQYGEAAASTLNATANADLLNKVILVGVSWSNTNLESHRAGDKFKDETYVLTVKMQAREGYMLPVVDGKYIGTVTFDGIKATTVLTSGDTVIARLIFPTLEIPKIEYTITFNNGGGIGTMSPVSGDNGIFEIPEGSGDFRPQSEYYEFDYWALDGVSSKISGKTIEVEGNHTLYAVWKRKERNVTIDPCNGDALIVYTWNAGSTHSFVSSDLFRAPEGMKFAYWYAVGAPDVPVTEINLELEDLYFNIKWVPEECKISYDANGGSGRMVDDTVPYGETFTLPQCTLTGPENMRFLNWEVDSVAMNPGEVITVYDHMVVKAIWDGPYYKVTFNANGGEGDDYDETVLGQDKWLLPATTTFTRQNYEFVGWSLSDSEDAEPVTFIPVTNHTTVYAVWEEHTQYTVALYGPENSKGIAVLLKEIPVYVGGTFIFPEFPEADSDGNKIVVTDGMEFGCWNLDSVDYGVGDTCVVENDLAVYAVYKGAEGIIRIEDIDNEKYDGTAKKPAVKVYMGNTLLEEKKDYTVTYKNNTNAYILDTDDEGFDIAKAPKAIITGKGNFSGKYEKTFVIEKADIAYATVNDIVLPYTEKAVKFSSTQPAVVFNGKKLVYNKDYVVSDGENVISETSGAGVKNLVIEGTGNNFAGKYYFSLTIVEKDQVPISKLSIAAIPSQPYNNGEAITPLTTITYAKKRVENQLLSRTNSEIDTEKFRFIYTDNTDIGTATVLIIAKAGSGFVGTKTMTFKITGASISTASLESAIPAKEYDGTAYKPEIGLKTKTGAVENENYIVGYEDNPVNAGTRKLVVTGQKAYTGTKTFTYKINPYDVNLDQSSETSKIVVTNKDSLTAEYVKGGAKVSPIVKFGDVTLVEGVDYTLSFARNTAVASRDKMVKGKLAAPVVNITFKGNFKGSIKNIPFEITGKVVSSGGVDIQDKVQNSKLDSWKQTAYIITVDGKKLAAGTDYDKAGAKYFIGDEECTNCLEKLDANTKIRIEVPGKNNYAGSTFTGEYRIMNTSIATAKVVIPNQLYTGQEIKPAKGDMTVTIGKTVTLNADDFEIVGFEKNTNKGTATVIIHGVGVYGGIKKATFKIVDKTLGCIVKFNPNGAAGKVKTQIIGNIFTRLANNTYARRGYTFTGWNTAADGSGKSYSNGELFSLFNKKGKTIELYAQWELNQ